MARKLTENELNEMGKMLVCFVQLKGGYNSENVIAAFKKIMGMDALAIRTEIPIEAANFNGDK